MNDHKYEQRENKRNKSREAEMVLHLHSFQVLLYITALTAVYLSPVINAQSVDVNFNDTRCGDGRGVCPTDPLLFTCMVTSSPADSITVRIENALDIDLRQDNTIVELLWEDGFTVQSHNVQTNVGSLDYTLVLSIVSASLLNGSLIICDSNILNVDDGMAGCPVAVLGDPGPPLNLTHDMSANTVSSAAITWDPPSTTGGDGINITGYRLMSSDGGLNLNEIVNDTTYTITDLEYNTDYSVEVTALNSCGLESVPASVVVNIEARVPPTPSLLPPELYCDVSLEDGRPVIIRWMPGDEIDGVVYPGVVYASVHLDPGDGTCTSADSTNCSVTITSEGIYNVSLTLSNDVGISQPVLDMFDLAVDEDASSGIQEYCLPTTPTPTPAPTGDPEPPVDDGCDSTSDGLSAGAAAGLGVALTILALAVGVVLGCSGSQCVWRHGRGPSGKQKMERVEGAIYEVPGPGPVDTAIPLTDNQAYGQVKN